MPKASVILLSVNDKWKIWCCDTSMDLFQWISNQNPFFFSTGFIFLQGFGCQVLVLARTDLKCGDLTDCIHVQTCIFTESCSLPYSYLMFLKRVILRCSDYFAMSGIIYLLWLQCRIWFLQKKACLFPNLIFAHLHFIWSLTPTYL